MDTNALLAPRATALVTLAATLLACAASPIPPSQAVSPSPPSQAVSAPPVTSEVETTAAQVKAAPCELVCDGSQVLSRPADTPDFHAAAVANADEVLGAMHDDLLACYQRRVAVNPKAHAFLTVDIVVETDGSVRTVETTGGALLGAATLRCIVRRIEAGTFAPVEGGGTRRIHVPLTFRRIAPGSSI